MMNLAEYRSKSACLADYLPWVALVAEGAVLNKDGSFQRTAAFRGPDLDSATPAELVAVTARLNNAIRRLGSRRATIPDPRSPIRHPHWSTWSAASSSGRKERISRAVII
jgi:type IV secretory pathway VirB4 component